MNPIEITSLTLAPESPEAGQPLVIEVRCRVDARILFELDLALEIYDGEGQRVWFRAAHQDGASANWLPRGEYRWRLTAPEGSLPLTSGRLLATVLFRDGPHARRSNSFARTFANAARGAGLEHGRYTLDGDPDPSKLSWRRGHSDWFFRHFDHAAPTAGSYLLKDSELLRGRILDVGCGDGITDLGLYLRYQPERLVGIDPFGGYERLADLAAAEHIPMDPWPEGLEFFKVDANHLPFEDDSFDVVISWGSVEHIAGGYLQALREIKRVLRPDGLMFIHPGLFYSNPGSHLGEFSDEAFFHLKKAREELREFILNTPPRRMDRAGHVASNAEYWQWFTELNPITVDGFERELRALEFEPWRVAIRTEDIIEYTPELLGYPMQDLATAELYLSCWNRKRPRPKS
jgi:SAM-dependent methyltransferase